MKKVIIVLSLLVLFITGCGNTMNTPTDKVEEFLGKYQSMDSEVLTQLDKVISNDTSMSDEQKRDYQALMEKQYQNLSYKIKEEDIDGDEARVLVEIEVYDYANSIIESREYYNEHQDEFENDKDNNTNKDEENLKEEQEENKKDEQDDTSLGDVVEDIIDSAFIDYKIKQLKDVTDKAKYELTFHLTRKDGKWQIEDLTDVDRQKIHGLFEG